jgi:hypothetical protein
MYFIDILTRSAWLELYKEQNKTISLGRTIIINNIQVIIIFDDVLRMMLLYYVHPTSWICIGKR